MHGQWFMFLIRHPSYYSDLRSLNLFLVDNRRRQRIMLSYWHSPCTFCILVMTAELIEYVHISNGNGPFTIYVDFPVWLARLDCIDKYVYHVRCVMKSRNLISFASTWVHRGFYVGFLLMIFLVFFVVLFCCCCFACFRPVVCVANVSTVSRLFFRS